MRCKSEEFRRSKRQKLQQNIRSMFLSSGPKFTEAVGLQRVCQYCNRRFTAPQGLTVHLYMRERPGDLPFVNEKPEKGRFGNVQAKRPILQGRELNQPPADINLVAPQAHKVVEAKVKEVVKKEFASTGKSSMTRRFTMAES